MAQQPPNIRVQAANSLSTKTIADENLAAQNNYLIKTKNHPLSVKALRGLVGPGKSAF
jgi:hypothetical protein